MPHQSIFQCLVPPRGVIGLDPSCCSASVEMLSITVSAHPLSVHEPRFSTLEMGVRHRQQTSPDARKKIHQGHNPGSSKLSKAYADTASQLEPDSEALILSMLCNTVLMDSGRVSWSRSAITIQHRVRRDRPSLNPPWTLVQISD